MSQLAINVVNSLMQAPPVVDENLGNENLSAKDFSIPRIKLLQALSPECQRGAPTFVEGAQAGMYMANVDKKAADALYVAPLFQDTIFSVWKKRNLGGGRLGAANTMAEAEKLITEANVPRDDYDINEEVVQTLAVLDPETGKIKYPAVFSMSSTALGVARDWNTALAARNGPAARFSSLWKLDAVLKTAKRGGHTYYSPQPTFVGFVDAALYDELKTVYNDLQRARSKRAVENAE